MSVFTDNEAGFDTSQPVEWYRVSYGSSQEFRYTSADVEITHLGKTYVPLEIHRSRIDGISDRNKSVLQVSVPLGCALADQLISIPPSASISLAIFRAQRADLADAGAIWVGTIQSREILGESMVLLCTNLLAATGRQGNALHYQKACPYSVYGAEGCGVNPDLFKTEAMAIVDSAVRLYAPGTARLADDWFIGGFVTYDDVVSKTLGKRFIVNYEADTGMITVFPQLRGVNTAIPLNFYAGCNHTSKQCHEKFDNLDNHGGDPVLPLVNPFDPHELIF